MEIALEYRPHKYQQELHDDPHRYIVVCAGRRFGKSVFARMHMLLNALHDPGLYWLIAPTYKQGKMIHWHELKKEVPDSLVTYKNEQELSMVLANGARLEIKGADNEDSLRGVGLKGVVLDETADQKPHVWEEIVRPMLLDHNGWAVFIGTPKGFNWFYHLWLKGRKGSEKYDPEWNSYRFTSYENPHLKAKEIDKAKAETDPDTFSQEYMAEFKRFKGLIYKEFDRELHVIESFEIPSDGSWEIYRGIDFGYGVNPTVCLWVAIAPDNKWYVIEEYYEIKDTSDYHVGMITAKSSPLPPVTMSFCDPANPQIREEWAKRGLYMSLAKRTANTNLTEWVATGIDMIAERLKISPLDHRPQFFVFKHCEGFIREMETYRWKEQPDTTLNQTGRPEKSNDHGPDALRYLAISYQGRQRLETPPDDKDWSFR